MRNANRCLASILLVFFVISASSCFRKFYKTNSISRPASEKLAVADSDRKIVVVHYADTIIRLNNVVVKHDTISGIPKSLQEKTKYLHPLPEKPNRFKVDRDTALSQVHIYVNETMVPNVEIIQIESAKIVRFDVYDLDKKATQRSRAAGIIGITVAAIGIMFTVLGIMAVALSSAWGG